MSWPVTIFRGGAGHQPPFVVHDVGSKAAALHFLQAANQILQIHRGGHHPKKTAAGHHRSAYQDHRPGRVSGAHHKSRAVVGPPSLGGGVAALEFTLQKRVGSNAAGGDSLGLGVQQRGVGHVIGGRNERLQSARNSGAWTLSPLMSPPLATCTADEKLESIMRRVSWRCAMSSARERVTVFCSRRSFVIRRSRLISSTLTE